MRQNPTAETATHQSASHWLLSAAVFATAGVILAAFTAINHADWARLQPVDISWDLMPEWKTVRASLNLALQGKGGYPASFLGWISFLSFIALARRAGQALVSRLNISGFGSGEFASSDLMIPAGLIPLCLFYQAVGFFGAIHPGIAWVLFAVGFIPLFQWTKESFIAVRRTGAIKALSDWRVEKIFFVAWFSAWSFTALIVPTFTDFLQNQLGLPYFYMNEGAIIANPYHVLSYFPQNCEMLLLHFVLLNSLVGLNLLLWSLWLLSACAVGRLTRAFTDERSGWIAGSWFAVVPTIFWIYSNGKNDLMALLYLVLGSFLLMYRQKDDENIATYRLVLASGLCFGMAMGTKYTAIVFLPPALLYLATRCCREKTGWKIPTLFGAGMLTTGGIWYIRNISIAGNPFYPLFGNLFPTRWIVPWHSHAEGVSLLSLGIVPALQKLVIILAGFAPSLGNLSPASASLTVYQWNATLPLLLFLIPGLVYARREWIWLIFFGACGIAAMLTLEPALRYYPALISFLCAATIVSIHELSNRGLPWLKVFTVLVILGSIFSPTVEWSIKTRIPACISILISGIDPLKQAQFSTGTRYPVDPQDLLLMGDHMNETLPHNARVLIVGDERPPLLRRRYLVQTDQAREIIDDWFAERGDLAGLEAAMEKEGITHILLNSNYLSQEVQYTAPIPRKAGERHRRALPVVVQFLNNNATEIASIGNDGLRLYSLKKTGVKKV